jgi:hypothetical protein
MLNDTKVGSEEYLKNMEDLNNVYYTCWKKEGLTGETLNCWIQNKISQDLNGSDPDGPKTETGQY